MNQNDVKYKHDNMTSQFKTTLSKRHHSKNDRKPKNDMILELTEMKKTTSVSEI